MTTLTIEYRLNGNHIIDWDESIDSDDIDTALDGVVAAAQNLTDYQPGDTLEMRVEGWDDGWVKLSRTVTL